MAYPGICPDHPLVSSHEIADGEMRVEVRTVALTRLPDDVASSGTGTAPPNETDGGVRKTTDVCPVAGFSLIAAPAQLFGAGSPPFALLRSRGPFDSEYQIQPPGP